MKPDAFERILRNVQLGGSRSSLSLERFYWDALDRIARERGLRTTQLIADIERDHAPIRDKSVSTSSLLRIFVAEHYRAQATRPAAVDVPVQMRPAGVANTTATILSGAPPYRRRRPVAPYPPTRP
ncbi:MAG TPA: ribbon-helix-helix domain-containing protein [Azospirillum sp.]|nr:ribbon-helix-helix domain-containing protein [Azospirillum sp.]